MGKPYYTNPRLITNTKNGKIRGRLSYRDANGERKRISKTLEATGKRAAWVELTAWQNQMEHEHEIAEKRGVEGIALSEMYVPDYVGSFIKIREETGAIEHSTAKSYRTSLRYIKEAFATMPIGKLQAQDVEEWEAGLTNKGYSSSTVGKAHRILKQALDSVVLRGAIDRNPVDGVKPPKRINQEKNALDKDTRNRLITAMEAMQLSPVIVAAYIALYTGMRREEVCGLQWRDINEEKRFIWIRRAFGEGGGKGNSEYLKNPKTDLTRDVPMSETLARILSQWKKIQQARFSENLATVKPDSYVLGDAVGHYRMDKLTREWSSLADILGIVGTEGRKPTFHDLRHTFATFFLAAGGDVNTCASILGHADVSMTLNTYARADPNAKRASNELIENNMR